MKKILIIDDETELSELMSDRLQLEGFQMISAADGEEGLKTAIQEKPDLILLDLLIPKLDGKEVFKQLRSNALTSSIRVIVLTAQSSSFDSFWEKEVGSFNFLIKPFDFSQLILRINGERRKGS